MANHFMNWNNKQVCNNTQSTFGIHWMYGSMQELELIIKSLWSHLIFYITEKNKIYYKTMMDSRVKKKTGI